MHEIWGKMGQIRWMFKKGIKKQLNYMLFLKKLVIISHQRNCYDKTYNIGTLT